MQSVIASAGILVAALFTAAAAAAYHPEPRVIVSVTELKGGHERDLVQRAAREAWGGIVRCYKQLGGRSRGTLTLRLDISPAGQVVGAHRVRSTLNDEVSKCLAGVLRGRAMPRARSGSRAIVDIELAPGDR